MAAGCRDHWHVTAELQRVSEALLGMEQDRATFERFTAPLRCGDVEPAAGASPPPFVL
jgi:hypothetical protein